MDTDSPINPISSIPPLPSNSQFPTLPPNEFNAVSSQPKKKHTLIIILGISISLLIIVLAGYQLLKTSKNDIINSNQNPTPTQVESIASPTLNPSNATNWQVFEDQTYGFQIKYPSDTIQPLERTADNGLLENNSTFLFNSLGENPYTLILSIEPNSNNLNPKAYILKQVEDTNQGEGPPSTIKPELGKTITINSQPAFQINKVFAYDRDDIVTIICNQKYCATVRYIDGSTPNQNFPEAEKYSAIFDQMLQSFQFTSTSTTSTTTSTPTP